MATRGAIGFSTGGTRAKGEDRYGTMQFEPYDPTWLADLVAVSTRPEVLQLSNAVRACTMAAIRRDAGAGAEYHYFVDPVDVAGNVADTVCLDSAVCLDSESAAINIDVLRDGRIGGVELLWSTLPPTTMGLL